MTPFLKGERWGFCFAVAEAQSGGLGKKDEREGLRVKIKIVLLQ